MKCQKCNRLSFQIERILKRVSPKGERGVWECYPRCGAKLSLAQRLDAALALDEDFDERETESYE